MIKCLVFKCLECNESLIITITELNRRELSLYKPCVECGEKMGFVFLRRAYVDEKGEIEEPIYQATSHADCNFFSAKLSFYSFGYIFDVSDQQYFFQKNKISCIVYELIPIVLDNKDGSFDVPELEKQKLNLREVKCLLSLLMDYLYWEME